MDNPTLDQLKAEAFDLVRKITLASKRAREWQAELAQLEARIVKLEQEAADVNP
jgi:BMFP domain-containing protein YqiC